MILAYGDESMDEARQRVTAVAAVTGTENDWITFQDQWIARNEGVPFHAADCDVNPGRGNYSARTHDQNKALYRDLTSMLADSRLSGYGVAVDMVAQRKVFPNAIDFTYLRAFVTVINFVKQVAEAQSDIAEITFDVRIESDHNAAFMYADYREDAPGWKEHLAPKISFENDLANPRIQVADLLARETMKALDNTVGPVKRPERRSWLALHQTGRFHIAVFSDRSFQYLKRKIPAIDRHLGFTQSDYFDWLFKNKRQHNTTNVLLFIKERTKGRDFPDLAELSDE